MNVQNNYETHVVFFAQDFKVPAGLVQDLSKKSLTRFAKRHISIGKCISLSFILEYHTTDCGF